MFFTSPLMSDSEYDEKAAAHADEKRRDSDEQHHAHGDGHRPKPSVHYPSEMPAPTYRTLSGNGSSTTTGTELDASSPESYDPETQEVLTDGMTPFDVLSSVFGATLAPSELEEALAAEKAARRSERCVFVSFLLSACS